MRHPKGLSSVVFALFALAITTFAAPDVLAAAAGDPIYMESLALSFDEAGQQVIAGQYVAYGQAFYVCSNNIYDKDPVGDPPPGYDVIQTATCTRKYRPTGGTWGTPQTITGVHLVNKTPGQDDGYYRCWLLQENLAAGDYEYAITVDDQGIPYNDTAVAKTILVSIRSVDYVVVMSMFEYLCGGDQTTLVGYAYDDGDGVRHFDDNLNVIEGTADNDTQLAVTFSWTVDPELGTLEPATGVSTQFTAGTVPGTCTVTAAPPYGGSSGATDLSIVDVEITNMPMAYYTNCGLDVPLCFRINGLPEPRLAAYIQDMELTFSLDGVEHSLSVDVAHDLYEGDLVDGTTTGDNVFTVLIPAARYLNFGVVENDLTTNVSYKIHVMLGDDPVFGDVECESASFPDAGEMRFGDDSIAIHVLGTDGAEDPLSSGHRQTGVQQDGEAAYDHLETTEGGVAHDSCPSERHVDAVPYGFEDCAAEVVREDGLDYVANAYLYDPDYDPESNNYCWTIYRAGVYNIQRGVYFGIYYGCKFVGDREVVDVTQSSGSVNIESLWNASVRAEIADAHSTTDVSLPDLTLSVLGTAGICIWFPPSWPAATFAIATNAIGYMMCISPGAADEKACVWTYKACIVNDKNGNSKVSEQSSYEAYTVDGDGEKVWPSQEVQIDMQGRHAEVGDMFYVYLRGSLYAQAKSGYLFEYACGAQLIFETGDCPNFDVTSTVTGQ